MKIKQTSIVAMLLIGILVFLPNNITVAKAGDLCGDVVLKEGQGCCGGVVTSVISCDQTGGTGNMEDTGLWGLLMLVINIMSVGIGVLAVGGIVYGSIMYSSAGGNPEKSKKARAMLTNVIIGLVLYALMFALLNFLVPGGLFRVPTP